MELKDFMQIREIAKTGYLKEGTMRKLLREKRLPGFWCGNRFYVNVKKLKQYLDDE